MEKNKTKPRSVLVTRFSSLGDVAMTIPVLYDVCRANPDVRFVMATQPWPATMFVDAPDNLTVVDVDVRGRYKGLWGMVRLARKMVRHYGIDAVADLHDVIRSWMVDAVMWSKGVRRARIDKGRAEKSALIKGKRREQLTTTHERYRRVFEQLGLDAPDRFTRLFDGKPLPDSPLVPVKDREEHWIAVSPFASHPGKVYPMELMTEVIGRLSAIENTHIFLLGGGKAEKLALRPLAKRWPNVMSLAEVKHAFLDEFALLSRCDVMLTMDSANMHLASLVGLPAVSVWGATHRWAGFLGYKQRAANIIEQDLPCRPCGVYGENKCRFGDYRCLTGISPDRIVARVKYVLGL